MQTTGDVPRKLADSPVSEYPDAIMLPMFRHVDEIEYDYVALCEELKKRVKTVNPGITN